MPEGNPISIVERPQTSRTTLVSVVVFVVALVVGLMAALHYARLDLTLSHYDARAHLVVARRIVDSLTPGWRQIGAVWLPLPHLVNLPAMAFDWSYRTGYPAVAVSIVAMSTGLAALSGFLLRHTGSMTAAVAGPALILGNPNVLYLQSTPMTEPMLIGLALIALARVDTWIADPAPRHARLAGMALVLLALTRYEGWLIAGALVAAAATAHRSRAGRALALVPYLAGAVAGFLLLSWGSTGVWFVTSGFFEHDPATYHDAWASLRQVVQSASALGGHVLAVAALGGAVMCTRAVAMGRPRISLALTLVATAGLPLFAFFQGHPHRVRYMVPLVVAYAVLAGVAIGTLPRRIRAATAAMLVAGALVERPPLDPTAPMVAEAQWETPFRHGRDTVTRALSAMTDGTPVLASMGSLGHYMQEASHAGFDIASFVHEGNGDLWMAALESPGRYVRWVLVEERAEGGDMLAARARENPAYLSEFSRVAEGGGLALYRKRPAQVDEAGIDPGLSRLRTGR